MGKRTTVNAKFNRRRLRAELDLYRVARGLSWRQAAAEMGVAASTLTRLAQGKDPSVDGFIRMVAWVGIAADCFIDRKVSVWRGPVWNVRMRWQTTTSRARSATR